MDVSDTFSVNEIEQKLNSTMRTVEPNPDFVKKLRHQLTWEPESIVIEYHQQRSYLFLAGLLLITLTTILVWMIKRTSRSDT